MIDIYHSRRTNFRKCKWWQRTRENDIKRYILENRPVGEFYAKEISPLSNQQNQLGNMIMLDKNIVMLETYDDCNGISENCVVEYLNKIWFVDSVQTSIHIKETEFSNEVHGTWTISLRA